MSDFIPSLERRLYDFMQRTDYRPMKQHELVRALNVAAGKRRDVRKALKSMEAQGQIVCLRKNRWALPDDRKVLTGELSVHPDGYGFVTPGERDQPDIFIGPRSMGTALHGDRVQLALTGARRRRRGRRADNRKSAESAQLSGKVVRVLQRGYKQLAGLLKVTPHYQYVIPDNPRIQQNVRVESIAPEARSADDNHRVVVKLLEQDKPGAAIPGTVIEDLGPADAPGVDMLGVLRSHGLDETFPDKVEQASRALRPCAAPADEKRRRDLRKELLFTIDPEDARDYDDAVSLQRRSDSHWELSVHIADVAAYVEPESTIDKEARARGNSVYLVDRVITMLPRHLTEEVCSLAPNTDRYAHTVRMTISPRGKVVDYDTFPSLIRSSARLNYEQVQAFLVDGRMDGIDESVCAMLKDMHKLSDVLRRKRARNGSILFEMPEVRCVLDKDGEPVDIVPRKAYTAYHLIEEFMLAANQTVARCIAEKGYPAVYRIHEPPDAEQWERIATDLNALGINAPAQTRADLNDIAESVAGEPAAHIVNLAMLRNLKRAVYSNERAEHFGLAFSHYLHFTSPIRRYADLIVHRVLKAVERNEPAPYSGEEIRDTAEHITKTEKEADDAEQESIILKRIDYYAARLDAGDIGPYRALVTSMTRRGLLVELVDTLQRGLVPFALIPRDHYDINEARNRAVGRHTRHAWHIGDLLDVEIVRVDKARKLIDFRPVGSGATGREKPRRRKKNRRS